MGELQITESFLKANEESLLFGERTSDCFSIYIY